MKTCAIDSTDGSYQAIDWVILSGKPDELDVAATVIGQLSTVVLYSVALKSYHAILLPKMMPISTSNLNNPKNVIPHAVLHFDKVSMLIYPSNTNEAKSVLPTLFYCRMFLGPMIA